MFITMVTIQARPQSIRASSRVTHLHHEVRKSKFDCKWLIGFYQGNKFSQSLDKYNKNHLTNAKADYFFTTISDLCYLWI